MYEYIKAIINDTIPTHPIIDEFSGVVNSTLQTCIEFKIHPFTFYLHHSENHITLYYGAENKSPYVYPYRYIIPFTTTNDLEYVLPYYLRRVQDQVNELDHLTPLHHTIIQQLQKTPNTEITCKLQLYPNFFQIKYSYLNSKNSITFQKDKITFKHLDRILNEFKPNSKTRITKFLTKITE